MFIKYSETILTKYPQPRLATMPEPESVLFARIHRLQENYFSVQFIRSLPPVAATAAALAATVACRSATGLVLPFVLPLYAALALAVRLHAQLSPSTLAYCSACLRYARYALTRLSRRVWLMMMMSAHTGRRR